MMHPVRRYGSLVFETFTAPKGFDAITEKQAEQFWNRACFGSLLVEQNEHLALQYARPSWKHESYVQGDGSVYSERCSEWTLVYRYYPKAQPTRKHALQASRDYHRSVNDWHPSEHPAK
tara:strand:- start:32 stop:388 length:357 start_codon:yes stop_codon:yes gene_type:complete